MMIFYPHWYLKYELTEWQFKNLIIIDSIDVWDNFCSFKSFYQYCLEIFKMFKDKNCFSSYIEMKNFWLSENIIWREL